MSTAASIAMPDTLDLVRFLLARIEEEEAELKRRARRDTDVDPDAMTSLARLRAECQSKRQMIGGLQRLLVLRDQRFETPVREHAAEILRAMAKPYRAHAGYRSDWARI